MPEALLKLKISKCIPIHYEIQKKYKKGNIEYLLLSSSEGGLLLVRKPLPTERYSQFKSSNLVMGKDIYYILLKTNIQNEEQIKNIVDNF